MKTTAILFVAAIAIIGAQSAHAQVLGDDGSMVLNQQLPADQCPTYDSCSMAPGGGADPNSGKTSPAGGTCQANSCADCVWSTNKYGNSVASCQQVSAPKSCKCEIAAGSTGCMLTDTCYYHP